LHRHGIQLIGCFILGLDNDTPEVFDRTADFVQQYIDIPQISVLTPFPGTAQFAKMEREGRILHKDWSRYDICHVTYRPLGMTAEELEQGYRRTQEKIFSWTRMLGRATRRAVHPLDPTAQRVSAWSRWLSTLAPNLVYGSLGWVEPEDASSAEVRTARPASARPAAEEAA
jgi:hypothetical protein